MPATNDHPVSSSSSSSSSSGSSSSSSRNSSIPLLPGIAGRGRQSQVLANRDLCHIVASFIPKPL